jgi:predicted NodU family carbamoyl transferase
MPTGFATSPYMQTIAHCKSPELFPAIVHKDGTSRVQTVPNDGSGIRQLLREMVSIDWVPNVAQHQFKHTRRASC